MRRLKNLLLVLFIFLSAQARAGECQLSDLQLQRFTSILPYSYTCTSHTLNLSLPKETTASVLTLPIPFDLFEEQRTFHGLAKYYNGSRPVALTHWTGLKGRYLAFLVRAEGAQVIQKDKVMEIHWAPDSVASLSLYLGPAEGEFASIQYSYLWWWLAALCGWIESLLLFLGGLLGNAWGLAIIVLALLFKCIFLPLQLWVNKLQARNDYCEAQLKPKLQAIKREFDGEEAHNLIMAEYKKLGITPFYGMKPLIGPLFQLPVQIATFNVLGEMPQLVGSSLGWISDLAYPDTILPLLMTVISLLSVKVMRKSHGKYSLYLMSFAFLVLFYPFPAGMVLFWTMMNLMHLVVMVWGSQHSSSPKKSVCDFSI